MALLKEDIEEHRDNLESLGSDIKAIDSEREISPDELFPPEFMKRYTSSQSFIPFIEKSPSSIRDIESLQDKRFDEYVSKNTVFDTWGEMKRKAAEEWVVKQLGN